MLGVGEEDWEAARRALIEGDANELEGILHDVPTALSARDAEGHTLLGLACKYATTSAANGQGVQPPLHYQVVERLLELGADPSAAADDGWAPLHSAALSGHVKLARRLLTAGASREGRLFGTRGGSPLSVALFYGQIAVAELLSEPAVPNNLRSAAALGRPLEPFFVGSALSASAGEGTDFYRPLLIFPSWERSFSKQELLDEALAWAARNNRCGAMGELVARGANVSSNVYRGTPLLWAVYADCFEAASWLLDHGADPNQAHDFGSSRHGMGAVALHLAAQNSSLKCLRLLLERGADCSLRDGAHGATPLEWAEHVGASGSAAILRGS